MIRDERRKNEEKDKKRKTKENIKRNGIEMRK